MLYQDQEEEGDISSSITTPTKTSIRDLSTPTKIQVGFGRKNKEIRAILKGLIICDGKPKKI